MDKIELLNSLIEDTRQVKAKAEEFSTLGQDLLNQQPEEDSWSVLECIEHLNIADAHYLAEFDLKLPKARASSDEKFKTGFLGNRFVKMIKPKSDGSIPSPMKTLKKFRPEVNVHHDTMAKFLEDQDRLLEIIETCKSIDLNKTKITSAIGPIVTFRLGDGLRFLIGHNQRHIIQAQRAIETLAVVK